MSRLDAQGTHRWTTLLIEGDITWASAWSFDSGGIAVAT